MIVLCVRRSWRGRRTYCTQKKTKENPYYESLHLPRTTFTRTRSLRETVEAEAHLRKVSKFASLYSWQRSSKDRPSFLLSVPPPAITLSHSTVGSAVSKILADVIGRYKLLRGCRIQSTSEWDRDAFPLRPKETVVTRGEANLLQQHAQNELKTFVEQQEAALNQCGIMSHTGNAMASNSGNCIVETHAKTFWSLYEKDLLFRASRPVYWSTALETALSEANVEYNSNFKSTSFYIKFLVCNLSLKMSADSKTEIYALVWTSSPWMIPSNQMICFSKTLSYSLVQCEKTQVQYIIASNLRKKLEQRFSTNYIVKCSFEGEALVDATYLHPLRRTLHPFIHADYVKSDRGTGLSLGNPCHNFDDYHIAVKNSLPLFSVVDEKGCFTKKAGKLLEGKAVSDAGSESVLLALGDDVVGKQDYVTRCPYDWVHKRPVIIRPSLQWFLRKDKLKGNILNCLHQTKIIPKNFLDDLELQLESNSLDWCISCQNTPGIPVPFFYESKSGKPVLRSKLLEHWCKLFREHGASIWWTLPKQHLLPRDLLTEEEINLEDSLIRGTDVFDKYFTSAICWQNLLEETSKTTDISVEGLNQMSGWLHAAMLSTTALQNKMPRRILLLHCLPTNGTNQKLSKAIKNITNHWSLMIDSKKKGGAGGFGADALRWWMASCSIRNDPKELETSVVGSEDASATVKKIRMNMWFLLGNLNDFDSKEHLMNYSSMGFVDRLMLHYLSKFQSKILKEYEDLAFEDATNTILNFFCNTMSTVYLQSVKDRLFSGKRTSNVCRSSQSCCHFLVLHLVYAIAPILPHLAEEVFLHYPVLKDISGCDTLFQSTWPNCPEHWLQAKLEATADIVLSLKSLIDKISGASNRRSLNIVLQGSEKLIEILLPLHSDVPASYSDLADILEVANIELMDESFQPLSDGFKGTINSVAGIFDIKLDVSPRQYSKCCRCSRYVVQEGDICIHCTHLINAGK